MLWYNKARIYAASATLIEASYIASIFFQRHDDRDVKIRILRISALCTNK